jgi:uncharacterized membrane protein
VHHKKTGAIALILVTLVAMAISYLDVLPPEVRVLGALPLIGILPGYVLMLAVVPRRSLGIAERLVFSVGGSLAIVVLGGFLLNWLPGGLQPSSFLLMAGGFTLIASIVALLRSSVHVVDESVRTNMGIGRKVACGILYGMAAAIVISAVAVAWNGAAQAPTLGFTQLWMVPDTNDQNTLHVGITNQEGTAAVYRLQLEADSVVVQTWAPITLNPGEQTKLIAELPARYNGTHNVAAALYRSNQPDTVYRRVNLWRDVQKGRSDGSAHSARN